jgi:hypothetical protein
LDTSPLTDASKQKAERELRETPENIEPALKELRLLLKDEPGLTIPINEDEFLLKFLRPCKFYPKSAFEKMKNFYRFRVNHKKICKNLMPEMVEHVCEQDLLHLQPDRDQFGRRLIIINIGKIWKPSKCPIDDIFRCIQLWLEAAMTEPNTQINGAVVIFDMDGLSLTHIMQFTPSIAMMILDWVQDCIPLRLKGIHIVNNSYLFSMLFTIFKPFIREKLRKRIFFHNKDWKSLHQHVNKEILRPKFGGTLDVPEVEGKLLGDLLKYYNKRFEDSNLMGYLNEMNK